LQNKCEKKERTKMDKYYQIADYILNHYNRNSHADKLVLANYLKNCLNDRYNDGLKTAIDLIKENEVGYNDYAHIETLICGLTNSKLSTTLNS
jgi:hypothetical protein